MITFEKLTAWRDRLAAATGASKSAADSAMGAELKADLGHDVDGDPVHNIRAAMALCEACGLQWLEVASSNDVQSVRNPRGQTVSGFHILNGNAALAMCRGIVAELWLAHPAR